MAKVLLRILAKLELALMHGMARVLVAGKELALRASELSVAWGNVIAYEWRFDKTFWLGLGRAAKIG
jgi:hypothetical protein